MKRRLRHELRPANVLHGARLSMVERATELHEIDDVQIGRDRVASGEASVAVRVAPRKCLARSVPVYGGTRNGIARNQGWPDRS